MFVVQMIVAGLAFIASFVVALQAIVDDNSHVLARKLMVAAILLAIVAYLIK
jgi:hypothetical protein